MSYPIDARPSRRRLLALGAAAAAGSLLSGCGTGGDAAGSSATPSTSQPNERTRWSFTDDRGETITADTTPSRIVAFTGTAAALVDLGLEDKIVGVFGETTNQDGTPHPQAGDLDVDKVAILGNVWGEFNVEKYAALRPDLLVTHMYDPGSLWYVPDESKDTILRVAPSVAINVARVPILEPIQRYAELAEALGADLTSSAVTEAKARFEAAADSLREAVRANPGIKVMAASGSQDLLYVSNPKVNTDLLFFAELGVDLVQPEKLDAGGYYESLSWENADTYAADLILLDSRSTALQPDDLAAMPSWTRLPAVKADQITPWDSVPRFSYKGFAPNLERLAEAIRKARRVR